MDDKVTLENLVTIVEHLGSARFREYLDAKDVDCMEKVVAVTASTLRHDVVASPDAAMLRCQEARKLAGYLRAKYASLAKRTAEESKAQAARADEDVRDEMERSGQKATEARVSARVRMDDGYQETAAVALTCGELADHMAELRESVVERLEVLKEISRTARVQIRDKDD